MKCLLLIQPVLLALFLQAMYGAVDLLIVGKFASSADVSAVSTGSQIMMTLTNLVSSFSMGVTASAGVGVAEKAVLSYILTFIEPVLMLVLMLILPPLLGGQIMIWWSTVFARIISPVLALLLTNSLSALQE